MRRAQPDQPTPVLLRPTGPPIEDQEETLILDQKPRANAKVVVLLLLLIPAVLALAAFAAGLYLPLFDSTLETLATGFFWIGVLLSLSIVFMRTILTRERLWLDRHGLQYRWTVGLFRGGRSIPLAEIEGISLYCVMVADSDDSVHAEHGLEIETLGQPLRGGQSRDRDEVIRLRDELEQHLRRLNPAWVNCTWCGNEVLEKSRTLREPPSDCTIRCRRDWDRTEFTGGFRTTPSTAASLWLAGLVGIAISCILLVKIVSEFDWFLLSCLILGGLTGLGLLAPWVHLVRGRPRWVIRPGEVTSTTTLCGFSWSRTFDVEWLDRIELRRMEARKTWSRQLSSWIEFNRALPRFALALVDLKENDVAVFLPVTKGEALWMAGIIAEVLKDAFPKDGETFARWSVSADAQAAGGKALGDRWLDEPVFS